MAVPAAATAGGSSAAAAAAAAIPASRTNTLARLHGPRDLRTESHPLPPPGPGEVTVAVAATGLCGSDLHYYLHGANGAFRLRHPMCLGHESAGIVVDVGPPLAATAQANGSSSSSSSSLHNGHASAAHSDGFRIGDRVAIEAGLPCRNLHTPLADSILDPDAPSSAALLAPGAPDVGSSISFSSPVPPQPRVGQDICTRCAEGRYNLCPRMRFASSAKTFPHIDGTLRRYINWPAWALHRLPSNVSLLSASLVEPLSVVLQGFERARFCHAPQQPAGQANGVAAKGETILVLGAGAVGLLACAAAKARGAAWVVAVDIDQGRLDFAKRMGWADEVTTLPRPDPAAAPKVHPAAADDERVRRKAEDDASAGRAQAQAAVLLRTISAGAAAVDASSDQVDAAPLAGRLAEGFDLVFECTGVPACVQMGIYASRPGGRIALVGMGHPIQSAFPIGPAALREVDIIGVFRYASIYPLALDMLSSGVMRQSDASAAKAVTNGAAKRPTVGGIENVVSHRYALEHTAQAFETMRNGKSDDGTGVVKVFIVDEELVRADDLTRAS